MSLRARWRLWRKRNRRRNRPTLLTSYLRNLNGPRRYLPTQPYV